MTQYHPSSLDPLRNKVVVLTGGASGICAELARICHSAGAHVFFGDVLEDDGHAVEKELTATGRSNHARFVKMDAANYSDNLRLFDAALQTCGHVDHAVSAAGISERGNLCDPQLDLQSVRQPPDQTMQTLDINLIGPLYFSRIASVYLRQPHVDDKSATAAADKSLTLVSSIAGITETPGLTVYSSAKHGVIGLMRALRKTLIKAEPCPIRTNAICPWMTKTRLARGIEEEWLEAGLPSNEPVDVAKIMAGVLADGKTNGAALYVEGGNAWETEEGYDRTQPQWMGEELTRTFLRGQVVLGLGENWQKKKQ
ncbi:hypothetical protein ANO11243_069710 [Dothideomycetidae sp. 11243]|nr:hypothetical protein ANO11243_069710 [fungal sp. No.11243]